MVYSYSWDETTPSGSSDASLGDDRIRELKTTVREALNDEHTSLIDAPTGPLMHEWAVVSKSIGSPYSITSSDHVILVTTGSSSDYTVVLPTAVGITGKPYKIKKVDSGTTTVIINTTSSQTIDGASSWTLYKQNDYVDLVSDGSNWKIVSGTPVSSLDWDTVWSDSAHDHSSAAEGGTLVGGMLKFLSSPTNLVNWSSANTWTDVDISSHTGTDTAKAALCAVSLEFYATFANNPFMTGFLRKNGSSEDTILPRIKGTAYYGSAEFNYCYSACMMIVEVDGSEVFETKLQLDSGSGPTSIVFKIDLIGYFV